MSVHTKPGLAAAILAFFVLPGCGGSSPKKVAEPEPEDDRISTLRGTAPEIDEEPDDGLAVQGLRGRLSTQDIQQGFEPRSGELTDCFTRAVGKRRYLGGAVEFKFVVSREGTVKTVQLQSSDLGAWPMEQCMLRVAASMTFPKPKGNAEADFTVPLSFSARQGTAYWDEARTEGEVQKKILPELGKCAREAKTADPDNVVVTLYVGTRGKILSAGFASPGAPLAEAWATCAAAKLTAASVTDPRGQITKATFRYNPS